MNEYPVFVPFGQEHLAGILTVPDASIMGLWILLPGQGAPRGTQYNFPLLTEVARQMAERGLASIRMDHLGVGDSTGRLEVLSPGAGREEEPIALARFGMEVTGATAVGFAGHCYGARVAVEAGLVLPECVGVIAAHFAPPLDPGAIPVGRRLRHRIRMWKPVASLSQTAFGRRVLEPLVSALFGRSRRIEGVSRQLDAGLRSFLLRASLVFISGDDEARYHLRLRPFLDGFIPTLAPGLSDRIESVLTPAKELGGYMALEAQLKDLEIMVDRAVSITASNSRPTRESGIQSN